MTGKIREFLQNIRPGVFFNENTFTVILYTGLIVYLYGHTYSFSLDKFGRIVSIATLEGISIGKRINLFYQLNLIALISFFLIHYITRKLSRFLEREEIRIINYSSIAALGVIFSRLFGMPWKNSILFLINFQVFVLISAVIEKLIFKKRFSGFINYIWTVLLAISMYFLFGFTRFSHLLNIPMKLPVCVYLVVELLVILLSIKFNGKGLFEKRLFVFTTPVMALPLVFGLTTEIYLILNNKGYYSLVPYQIYVIELILLGISGLFLYLVLRKKLLSLDSVKLVFSIHIPVLIFGLFFCLLYRPFISLTSDLYEPPNMVFMVQQFFEFGRIPFLESFSAHFLSDSLFPFIYAFINGFNGYDICIYNFLIPVFAVLFYYFFFYIIIGEPLLGLFLIFLTPFYFEFVGSYTHWVSGIAMFLLIYAIRKNNFFSYLALFSFMVFTFLWRLDIGSSTFISVVLCLIVFNILFEEFKINKKAVFLSITILVAVLFALLIPLASHKNVNLVLLSRDFYHIVKSDPQNSGYPFIWDNVKNYIFLFHYFLFPSCVLLLLIYLLTDFKDIIKSGSKNLYIALIYFIFYYDVIFTRALIRHNIHEGWDPFSGGICYLILCSSLYLLLRRRGRMIRVSAFVLMATVLIYIFKVPSFSLDNSNNLEKLITEGYVFVSPENRKINRVQGNFYDQNYGHFKGFLDSFLDKDETFLDFSNSPMLYFYTGRMTPSYSCYPPSILFNEYLQERYIEDLKKYRLPVVIFSNKGGGILFDGLPSNLRQYKVAEYIYKYYEPYGWLDSLQIWVSKGDKRFYKNLISFSKEELTAGKDGVKNRAKIYFLLKRPLEMEEGKYYSLRIHYSSVKGGYIRLLGLIDGRRQNLSFYLPAGNNTLNIPVKMDKQCRLLNELMIKGPQSMDLLILRADIIEGDCLIDSSIGYVPQYYNLKYMPFFWGKYEKDIINMPPAGQIYLDKEETRESAKSIPLFDLNKKNILKYSDIAEIRTGDGLKVKTGPTKPYIYAFVKDRVPLSPERYYGINMICESRTGGRIQLFWNTDNKGFNEKDSAFYELPPGRRAVKFDLPLGEDKILDDLRIAPPINDEFSIYSFVLKEGDSLEGAGIKFSLKKDAGYKNYYIILKCSNSSEKMVPVELNYGDHCRVNGGFTFYIPARSFDNIHVIRPGVHYNWSSVSNNAIYINSVDLDNIKISDIKITGE